MTIELLPEYQQIFDDIVSGKIKTPMRPEWERNQMLIAAAREMLAEIGFDRQGMTMEHLRWCAAQIADGAVRLVNDITGKPVYVRV